MVVISIISMLSSIIFVNVEHARSKGRDAVRMQQIKQIDTAIKLYTEENGHAPYLKKIDGSPLCEVQSASTVSYIAASACFAVSTAAEGTDQKNAWNSLKSELSPYLSDFPDDPCVGGCDSGIDGADTGYYYAAPLAVQYSCQQADIIDAICDTSVDDLNDSYQLYTDLENDDESLVTNDGDEELFDVYYYDITPPTIPGSLVSSDISTTSVTISWAPSTDEDTEVVGYRVFRDGISIMMVSSESFTDTMLESDTAYTYTISAVDALNNESAESGPLDVRTLVGDVTPPVIAEVNITNINTFGATISWTTDKLSNSSIEYGTSTSYSTLTGNNDESVTDHSVNLSGLYIYKMYYFKVTSTDGSGNRSDVYTGSFRTDWRNVGTQNNAVNLSVNGQGRITVQGRTCPSLCAQSFPAGSFITVEAIPDASHTFVSWDSYSWQDIGGLCSGSNPVCTFVVPDVEPSILPTISPWLRANFQ